MHPVPRLPLDLILKIISMVPDADIRRHFGIYNRVHIPPAVKLTVRTLAWQPDADTFVYRLPNATPRGASVPNDHAAMEMLMRGAWRLTLWRLRPLPQEVFDCHVGDAPAPDGCFWEKRCITDSDCGVFQALVAMVYPS